MSDSKDSTVTYIEVFSPFEGLSDIGSLGVEGPRMMPEDSYAYIVAAFQDSPSPNYVPGPKDPEEALPLTEFVPKLIHPEFMPPEDEILLAEEQPLPATDSPTANLPRYIPKSDHEEDPADYPADGRDDDDDDDESSDDDEDDDDDVEEDKNEESDVLEVTLPHRKRLCIALGPRYEVGESSSAPTAKPTRGFRVDYGFVATLDDEIRRDPKRETELVWRMTDFITTVRHDTDEIYGRLDDAHDDRVLKSGQFNMLRRDRHDHAWTARLIETKARLSRQAWVQSIDVSDIARAEVALLCTTVLAQQSEITGLRHVMLAEAEMAKTVMTLRWGTEGVVELTHWFEIMEPMFCISNCTVENQIKFATCTLLGSVLTWWNTHVMTVSPDVAYAMIWTNTRKKITDKYYPRGEIKNLEVELWNLKDIIGFTTELMDKKISTFAERQAKNKRKFEDNSKNNQNQQQNKKQNTGEAYTAGSGKKKPYGGSKPL
nr:hypothetical protein [Tanacetum cinerariifolium]